MSPHRWERASDRATVCIDCGTVQLTSRADRGRTTFYGPRPEVEQADIPPGVSPPCQVGPLTISRLKRYHRAPLPVEPTLVVAAAQCSLFGGLE